MLRDEVLRYEQITGESAEHLPIVKIGAFLDGYDTAVTKPYEKFESTKDHIYKLAGDYKCWDNRLTREEALELCHILEQGSILDKIKAEIEQKCCMTVGRENDPAITLYDVFKIIDKYKTESEG